jgi:septal ring factor EnvC (AmiA/AmiB activator)
LISGEHEWHGGAKGDASYLTDAQGRRYLVSDSDYLRLSKLRDAIERERQEISAIKSKIEADEDNLKRQWASLNRTSQTAINAYNKKVDNLNRANAQMKPRLDAFNRNVDDFNAELKRVGTPER